MWYMKLAMKILNYKSIYTLLKHSSRKTSYAWLQAMYEATLQRCGPVQQAGSCVGARRAARPAGSLKSASVQANVGLAAEAAVADPKGRQDPASFEELQNFCEKRFNRKQAKCILWRHSESVWDVNFPFRKCEQPAHIQSSACQFG